MPHFQVFALDSVEVLEQFTVVDVWLGQSFVSDRCLWVFPEKIKQLRIGRLSSLEDVRLFREHEDLHGPHEFRVWHTAEPMREQLESLTLRKQHQQAVQSLDEIRVMLYIQQLQTKVCKENEC